jgi:hypothetical protein
MELASAWTKVEAVELPLDNCADSCSDTSVAAGNISASERHVHAHGRRLMPRARKGAPFEWHARQNLSVTWSPHFLPGRKYDKGHEIAFRLMLQKIIMRNNGSLT